LFDRLVRSSFLLAGLAAPLAVNAFAAQSPQANAGLIFRLSPSPGPAIAQSIVDGQTQTPAQQQSTPPKCVAAANATNQMTPADLYPMVAQCIQENDFADALALFALAGMDVRYDKSRVSDKTTSDTGSVLVRRTFQPLPAAGKDRLGDVINAVSNDKPATEYLCRWTQKVGPPAYYPEYMILHGMNAITAGLTRTPLPQELLPVADPSGTWKAIVTSYLHCTLAEQSGPSQDAQAAEWYRKVVVSAPVRSLARSSAQAGQASQSAATPTSSQPTTANGDPTASGEQTGGYGPLRFNREGADFYFAQDGKFAPASFVDGSIVIHLHPASFQIGYNGEQVNICLAPIPFPEVRADPTGYKASCLSGPMSGARPPNSDALLVYSGSKWSDGNSALTDSTSMKTTPMEGFHSAYQVNQLLFIAAPGMSLGSFKGTLYGYIIVYKQNERSKKDIMPIQLIFE